MFVSIEVTCTWERSWCPPEAFLRAGALHHQKCPKLTSSWPALTNGHLHWPEQADTYLPGSSDHAELGSVSCNLVLVIFLSFLGQPLHCLVVISLQGDLCQRQYVVQVDFTNHLEAPVLSPTTMFTSTITTTAFLMWYRTSKRTYIVVDKREMLPNVSKGYDQTR